MSSRAAAYTPPPPTQLTSSPRRSSHVRVRPTAAAATAKVPAAPRVPREARKPAPVQARPKKPTAVIRAKAPMPKSPAIAPFAKKKSATVAPPPAAAALKLLQGGRSSKAPAPTANDTLEMKAPVGDERTDEMPVPELQVAETHRKLAAREKREKKLARARVKRSRARKSAGKIAGEKSGIRKKVQRKPAAPATKRKTTPPPIPAQAKSRATPPPIPAKAKSTPPPPARVSVAPPAPRASLASFAPPKPAPMPAKKKDEPPAPELAKVLHIPSREPTQQFSLPKREASTAAPVIPLSRVAPNDIAVPLVPTTPVPLTQPRVAAPVAAPPAAPVTHVAAFSAVSSGRQDTQQILLSAPAPFVGEDPNEDLLAPYKKSPLRALSRAITSLLG